MKWLIVLFAFFALPFSPAQAEEPWQEVKDKHFIVYYNFAADTSAARTVLRRAEEYYRKIADRIGYSRYSNFWTWDERVKIIIFPDQQTYMRNTGQPAWSQGYSDRDSALFKSRVIVTYRQENDFIDGVLPHEISHLILRDFLGFETVVPLWFEEGVAQLEEASKKSKAESYMRLLAREDQHIPFSVLMKWDIRRESDPKKVATFYLQSVSVVEFLITKYGSSAFADLCRGMKDGKSFEEALNRAYTFSAGTIEQLEDKWLQDMKR